MARVGAIWNGHTILGVKDVLITASEPTIHNQLFKKSAIKSRQAFIKYLRWCRERQLVYEIPMGNFKQNGKVFWISPKGRDFLEMIG